MKIEVPYFGIELSIDPGSLQGLSSESLRQMKIVPPDWKVEGEELAPRLLSGFSFENGVSFIANDDTLAFSEPLYKKPLADTCLSKIVRAYVASMPHLGYQSVDIQIMGHFKGTEKHRTLFLTASLEQSSWSTLGNLFDAELELEYDFGDCLCELSVKRMRFSEKDGSSVGVITFFAKFRHPINAKSVKKRLALVNAVLDSVDTDLNRYQKMAKQLVNRKERS
jgi:hypothetical protein